jgi:phage-related protein
VFIPALPEGRALPRCTLRQKTIRLDLCICFDTLTVKEITFLGSSLDDLREFPQDARRDAGFALNEVQEGRDPPDWKPMKTVGAGVREVRVSDRAGIFRVILCR